MGNDLVERLNKGCILAQDGLGGVDMNATDALCQEAAARILALEEALKPLLKLKEAIDECKDDTWECQCGRSEPWWTGSNAHYASEYPEVPK